MQNSSIFSNINIYSDTMSGIDPTEILCYIDVSADLFSACGRRYKYS